MKKILIKIFSCIIIFLILGIISKKNLQYRNIIETKLYQESISFSKINEIYNKYLGGIFPIELSNNQDIVPVFNEKLIYDKIEPYKEGAKLTVSSNYLIPNQESGIVIFIGEKENYGKVIILETSDNLNIWYGNICNYNVKLYDHLNKSDIIGETCSNELYMVYKKNNEVLDYKKYIN